MKYLILSLFGVIAIVAGLSFAILNNQVSVQSKSDMSAQTVPIIPIPSAPQASSTASSSVEEATSTPTVPEIGFLNPLIFQGDTLVADVSSTGVFPVNASLDGRSLSVFKYQDSYRIVGAIGATEKIGPHSLAVSFSDGSSVNEQVYVRATKFSLVDLGVPEKLGQTADELVQNLAVEQSALDSIVALKTNLAFSSGFRLPLADASHIAAPFGEIRKTGDQEIRHLGIDFSASKGTEVYAINNGTVREAEDDPIYGNMVAIDHGAGIFSLYMHLDQIKAKVGQTVKAGQILGTVGDTGYATGPHLHLSIKIGAISVDPVKFIDIFR